MTRILFGRIFFLTAAGMFTLSSQVAHGHAEFDAIAAAFVPLIFIPPAILNIAITSYILDNHHVTLGWRISLITLVLLLSLAGLIGGWILMLVIFLVIKFRNIIGKTHVEKI
jgi:hypothetical protein